jgi:hypothetical protein
MSNPPVSPRASTNLSRVRFLPQFSKALWAGLLPAKIINWRRIKILSRGAGMYLAEISFAQSITAPFSWGKPVTPMTHAPSVTGPLHGKKHEVRRRICWNHGNLRLLNMVHNRNTGRRSIDINHETLMALSPRANSPPAYIHLDYSARPPRPETEAGSGGATRLPFVGLDHSLFQT